MKSKGNLWKEYIKEKEEEKSSRIFRAVSLLKFWDSENIPFYKELLFWGYKKGLKEVENEKSKEIGAYGGFSVYTN